MDPHAARADRDPARAGADGDRGLRHIGRRVDARDGVVVGVGDPDRAGADRHAARAGPDRPGGGDDAGRVDARDAVIEVVDDPRRAAPTAIAVGWLPTATRAVTRPVRGSIRAIVESPVAPRPNRSRPRRGSAPRYPGPRPAWPQAGSCQPLRRLPGSMPNTLARGKSTVHNAPRPKAKASTVAPSSENAPVTSASRASIRDTDRSAMLSTHTSWPSAAMSPGLTPTATSCATPPRAGSITATEFAVTATARGPARERSAIAATSATTTTAPAATACRRRPPPRRPYAASPTAMLPPHRAVRAPGPGEHRVVQLAQ